MATACPRLPSSSPAGAFPLPSRFPSSSSASQTHTPSAASAAPATRSAGSPERAFALLSPQLADVGVFGSRWTADALAPSGGRTAPAGVAAGPAFAPAWGLLPGVMVGGGSVAVDTQTVFGAVKAQPAGKGKKRIKPPHPSHLVAQLARRTSSSSSSAASSIAPGGVGPATGHRSLDPAFLSNPFFSPSYSAGSPFSLAHFPPTSATRSAPPARRSSSRLSIATSPGADPAERLVPGLVGFEERSSSPLQPPTPPYRPPPPAPLLKRRPAVPLLPAAAGSQYPPSSSALPYDALPQFGDPRPSTSFARTVLHGAPSSPGLPHASTSTAAAARKTKGQRPRALEGVKKRRLLLAEDAAAGWAEDALAGFGGALGLSSSSGGEAEGSAGSAGTSARAGGGTPGSGDDEPMDFDRPACSRPAALPSPPPTDGELDAIRAPPAQPLPRILLRVPALSNAQAGGSTAAGARANKRRRISLSSSITSLESSSASEGEDEVPSPVARSAPPLPPPMTTTSRQLAQVRMPSPTLPLATTTRARRPAAGAPAPTGIRANASRGSSLSPSGSDSASGVLDVEEDVDGGPGVGVGSEDGAGRDSSPLTDISSVASPPPQPAVGAPAAVPAASLAQDVGRRTFPPEVDTALADEFPLWYRRFHLPRALTSALALALHQPPPAPPRPNARLTDGPVQGPADLYQPRWTRGIGGDKVGLCGMCWEDGVGEVWLKTKVSAFNFHMLNVHGISPTTGLPFSPPLRARIVPRAAARPDERTTMRQGLCHHCGLWVPIEGVKNVAVRCKEIFWWRHARACHGSSRIAGEMDPWVPSALLASLAAHVDALDEADRAGWIVPSAHISAP